MQLALKALQSQVIVLTGATGGIGLSTVDDTRQLFETNFWGVVHPRPSKQAGGMMGAPDGH